MIASVTAKSRLLIVIATVLAALVWLDRSPATVEVSALPALPAVAPETVMRITIADQINSLVLERSGPDAHWQLVAPLQYAADDALVLGFVKALGAGIPMDVRVDEGNLEAYGVDDQHALRAELYTGGAEPAVAIIVGKSAGPDSAFVRLPGSDTVYRAAVGARSRFERAAGEWRDRTLIDVPKEKVRSLLVARAAGPLRLVQDAGAWSLEGAGFTVDDKGAQLVVGALAKLRASEIHAPTYEAGFAEPAAVATLTLDDGTSHRIVLGSRQDARAAWIRVDDRTEIFRVASRVRTALLLEPAALRDLSLAGFDRLAIESVAWTEGSLTVAVAWNPEAVAWVVTQPANMEVDQKAIAAAAGGLAELRAVGIASDNVFVPSGAQVRVALREGAKWQLDLGKPGVSEPEAEGKIVRARVSGRSDVYLLDARVLAEIRGAFGR